MKITNEEFYEYMELINKELLQLLQEKTNIEKQIKLLQEKQNLWRKLEKKEPETK